MNPPPHLKQMTIFPFLCRILQLLSLKKMLLQEQVKILNQDALPTLGILPNIFHLTLIDTIVLEGEECCMHMLYV